MCAGRGWVKHPHPYSLDASPVPLCMRLRSGTATDSSGSSLCTSHTSGDPNGPAPLRRPPGSLSCCAPCAAALPGLQLRLLSARRQHCPPSAAARGSLSWGQGSPPAAAVPGTVRSGVRCPPRVTKRGNGRARSAAGATAEPTRSGGGRPSRKLQRDDALRCCSSSSPPAPP